MSVQCNLRHYSSFSRNWEMAQNLPFSSLLFSSFSVESGWSVQHVHITLNCLYPISVANPKSSGILSKAYGISFPGDLGTLLLSLPSAWEVMYLHCKTCSEVLKEKRTNWFHSNSTSLLAFHKRKPRGHKYQRVFFTKDEKLNYSSTQKGWRAWLKLGQFSPNFPSKNTWSHI